MAATAAAHKTPEKPEHEERGHEQTIRDFHEAVNMSVSELEKWLATEHSKEVGWKGADGHDESQTSVGHLSGERIVKLLRTKKEDLQDDDIAHMQKVVGYVHRHQAQRPKGDIADTRWAYSLKNWGHDPSK